ncbi:hypothetical protein DTO013E5_6467 [Penicillium roqueforti]|uniref:uncharacterized protein n=1 Tax=Penicillium roqueforti TaxID=5082 RepID=UPI00190A52E4|nr:uncharacterized protein LCP9604111_7460 [Penicillium roqueforti]KAF9244026.1 hypothetical protein LCP9604111_7460 [Penicillium roqueforti]KAI1831298.1 hypothetical protein CBS147337_7764 [Penicillium roqueforti]KAI2672804.1 hypothetical protein LCP963914a_9305 [Penicillium roqueforti]KAI2696123.1 hypothetical protein CBS147372_8614 [Penicillium roqueforti]KAI2711516.1 hypothetical protein CBS147354_8212 [Penicillium roqueforti]
MGRENGIMLKVQHSTPETSSLDLPSQKAGTVQDKQDMWRAGRDQELNVGGMIYTYLGGLAGFSFVILSMAEMASMAPLSGGQYHWVSEFAPPSSQALLSYITGWICVLGWHTGIAGCCYTVANMMVGVVAINYPDTYTYEPWHVTLLVIAVALVALMFNTFLAQKLPLIEGIILIVHCFGFFGILIPLWVLSPKVPASEVFGSIEDRGGWGNNGLSCMAGLVGPIYALIGPDSAVHMAEEIRDASRVLPMGMVWTLILNGSTGLVMIITFAFCVGDIDAVLESETGFPFIQVFLNATGSVSAATGMTVVIMTMQFCAAISNVATTSRQIYSFARDKGLPFSNFLAQVNPTFTVPLNALCVSLVIVSLLSLINIGSSVAFNAIMSLGTAALLSSYIISITCVRLRRWRNQPLPPARWSMGKFTPICDTISIMVLLVIWIFSFFPLTKDVDPTTMNWSVAIFGGVVAASLGYYVIYARRVYKGPVIRQFLVFCRSAHKRGNYTSIYLKPNEVFQPGPGTRYEDAQNQRTTYIPRLSPDTALTAFAQLGVLRFKAQRALISLFGRDQHYILAEATQTLTLQDHTVENDRDALWLGCCVVPKGDGICQQVASLPQLKPEDKHVVEGIYVVPDLREDDRFNQLDMVIGSPKARFYAGAPIISPKGITIGSYCIIDDEPRSGLDAPLVKFLQNMASTVMEHLDMARSTTEHHRAERMIVGLGSFMEGKATLRNEWVQDTGLRLNEQQHNEGHLNILQQNVQIKSGLLTTVHTRPSSSPLQPKLSSQNGSEQFISSSSNLSSVPSQSLSSGPSSSSSTTLSDKDSNASFDQTSSLNKSETQSSFSVRSTSTENLQADMLSVGVRQVFSRAANIIRESIEVEGVAFFDASIGSYGGLVNDTKRKGPGSDSGTLESSMDSSDDSTESDSQKSSTAFGKDSTPENTTLCEILGFSTSTTSSINDESKGRLALREVLLKTLLRRYPHGKIFNFSEEGSMSSDESSDGPCNSSLDRESSKTANIDLTGKRGTGSRKKTRSATLKEDGIVLIRLFPGARSIALLPMWDSHRARWFSGALVWTNTPRRVFTSETELTYLSAFGNSIMAEVHRLDVEMSEKAKTNLVSSISHELRSPLHGILGTSEILRDTAMDALQHGLVHTIESCGRTLLDTINHLLDFSKINNFRKEGGNKALHGRKIHLKRHKNTDPSPYSKPPRRTRHSGMISLKSDIQLDSVLEEVMESVFAGYSFYHSSQRSTTIDRPNPIELDVLGSSQQASQVSIILDIDEAAEWRFSTQIGAWRRIMMNIFGNSLKYTKAGFILVKLTSSPVTHAKDAVPGGPSDFKVTLLVKDTGIGMSMEYLQNNLFTPFTQEDSLAPGNGLGLSIVHHAVLSMGGQIEVSSLRGRGTEVSIEVILTHVPIQNANLSPSKPELILRIKDFTRGTTLGLLELGSSDIHDRDTILSTSLEKLCKNWFEMDVHILTPSDTSPPSCDFYVAVQTDTDSVNTWESWLSKTRDGNIRSRMISIVVICQSPEAAHLMSVAANQSNHEAIVEFISQPCGPRKLAKAFNICIKRQQGQEFPIGNDSDIDQPQEKNVFQLTKSPLVSREDIDAQRARDEMDFQKHQAGKQAIDDEYRKLEGMGDSWQHNDAPLPHTESDAITLPIRQGLSRKEEPTLTVLLVEDNDINLQILVAHMKKEGYRYTIARNGLEASNAFKAHPGKFGVVLMDISMPVMDGFESARLIRKAEQEYQNTLDISAKGSFRPATIVAMTGLASASAQHEAYGSGMDLFLTKPIKRKDLFALDGEIPSLFFAFYSSLSLFSVLGLQSVLAEQIGQY